MLQVFEEIQERLGTRFYCEWFEDDPKSMLIEGRRNAPFCDSVDFECETCPFADECSESEEYMKIDIEYREETNDLKLRHFDGYYLYNLWDHWEFDCPDLEDFDEDYFQQPDTEVEDPIDDIVTKILSLRLGF